MDRTKADFRARRELTGITQAMLADEMGVQDRSVRRWESPDYPGYLPPLEAWDIIDAARERQLEVISFAIQKAWDIERDSGKRPDEISLRLWSNQSAYEGNRADALDDGGDYRMANKNSILLANELERGGYRVSFEWD